VTFKTKRIVEWVVFSFLTVVLLISGSLLLYQQTYAGEIYRGVKVADIDLSGKTKKQALSLLQSKMNNILKKDVLLTAGDQKVAVKVADTGLNIDVNKIIDDAYSVGRDSNFMRQAISSTKTVIKPSPIPLSTNIDNDKFNSFVSTKIPGMGIEPKNAEIKIDNGVVSEIPEKYGQVVDSTDLTTKIIALSDQDDTAQSFTVSLATQKVAPKISTSDLASAKTVAEGYLSRGISLSYNGTAYKPSAADIGKWITFSAQDNGYGVQIDDNAVKTYLTVVAKNFEVSKVDKKINATDNSVIDAGRQGIYLDKVKALADVKSSLASKNSPQVTLVTTTEDPSEVKIFPDEGLVLGRFDGKYIDVDLTQQKLCQIESSTLIACYTISSGKPSTPTPTGTRHIESKDPRAWSAPYGLWMPWWESMGEGYGIHELPEWPSGYKEGEAHLGTPVSHGCVRLGVGPAEVVYNWTDIGTPVYIHK
jgi:vancomycin resistance protein YoaR